MTDEQINQRIAEACGLICLHEFQANKDGAKFGFWEYPKNWTGSKKQPWCLDFCHDLNAMHEAEKTLLDAGLLFEYGMHISIDHRYDYLLRATARERAEAFLRALGLWKTDHSGEPTEMEVQK